MSPFACSFCGKDRSAVAHLLAGPNVFICDECVSACVAVLEDLPPRAVKEGESRVASVPELQHPISTNALLVRVPDGSLHTCVRESDWQPFVHERTSLEWCKARGRIRSTEDLLVVAIRRQGGGSVAVGSALSADTAIHDSQLREVADRLLGTGAYAPEPPPPMSALAASFVGRVDRLSCEDLEAMAKALELEHVRRGKDTK